MEKVIAVFSANGELPGTLGEVGIDRRRGRGAAPYYVKLYDGSFNATGYLTLESALDEMNTLRILRAPRY